MVVNQSQVLIDSSVNDGNADYFKLFTSPWARCLP